MKWAGRAVAALACACSLAAPGADRVALLIGNNTYGSSPLRNAVNDAHDLGDALKDLGFQVILRENASRKDMIEGIREFGQAIDGASTALFFYAGHAMQFKDRNYLVPIDAAMGSEEDVTFFSVEIGQIFDRMDRARTRFNFIILDACRDNPFAASFRLTSAGLAQMSSPSGTLIAYATAPGSVAADGFGRNGIYTKHILQNIKVPDLPVEIMFKRVREGVERETRKLQTPWDSSSLKGDFTFAAGSGARGRPSSQRRPRRPPRPHRGPIPSPAARSLPACASSPSRTARSTAVRCAVRAFTARASTFPSRSSTKASSTKGSSKARAPTSGKTAIGTRATSRAIDPMGAASTNSPTATRTKAR